LLPLTAAADPRDRTPARPHSPARRLALQYIENPLLYRGRKFDLRVWIVALDNGDVLMYAPGYVRTSSEAFDLDSENRYAHLTNYCQQVLNKESFGKFEEGNTLTFADLEDYMNEVMVKGGGQ
jgi:tubulin--tyrosine ligase